MSFGQGVWSRREARIMIEGLKNLSIEELKIN
jgi:hypothetical protein